MVRSLRSLSRVFPTSRLARHFINVLLKIVARRALRSRCRSPRAVAACCVADARPVRDVTRAHDFAYRVLLSAGRSNFILSFNFQEFTRPRRPPLGARRSPGYGDTYRALCNSANHAVTMAEGTGTSIYARANYGIRHVSSQAVIGPPVSSENSELKTLYQVLLRTSYPP